MTAAKKSNTWVWILIAAVLVLPIVGLLALVLLGAGAGALAYFRLSQARDEVAITNAETVRMALESYRIENPGECPDVAALVSSRHLSGFHDRDPWGGEWRIVCDAVGTVESAGPDGSFGTRDDVRVPMDHP